MDWKPCLYKFKMPAESSDSKLVSAPLWALMDHLVAVVFHLHSSIDSPGVAELEWALGFLNSMKQICNQTSNLECLKKRIQNIIDSKFRNPSALLSLVIQDDAKEDDAEQTADETNENEEMDKLNIPITLQDILSHQPKRFRVKINKSCKGSSSACGKGQAILGYDQCETVCGMKLSGQQTNQGDQGASDTFTVTENLLKKELSRYLEDLKEKQNEIINCEQKHLQLIDQLLNKMN